MPSQIAHPRDLIVDQSLLVSSWPALDCISTTVRHQLFGLSPAGHGRHLGLRVLFNRQAEGDVFLSSWSL